MTTIINSAIKEKSERIQKKILDKQVSNKRNYYIEFRICNIPEIEYVLKSIDPSVRLSDYDISKVFALAVQHHSDTGHISLVLVRSSLYAGKEIQVTWNELNQCSDDIDKIADCVTDMWLRLMHRIVH